MNEVPNDIVGLKALVEQLLKKMIGWKTNAELRRRLGLNSVNSSKPLSSDGCRKKTVKPGLPKEGKGTNGGRKGHRGETLRRAAEPVTRQCISSSVSALVLRWAVRSVRLFEDMYGYPLKTATVEGAPQRPVTVKSATPTNADSQ